MKNHAIIRQFFVSLVMFIFFFMLAVPVNAGFSVAPGEDQIIFLGNPWPGGNYDDSKVECRKAEGILGEDAEIDCGIYFINPPGVGPILAEVFATAFSVPFLGIDPGVTSAAFYHEFEIPASEIYTDLRSFVDVQISVVYDVSGILDGKGAYYTEIGLSLKVEDVSEGLFVGGLELFERTKGGAQGFTDVVAIDVEHSDINDASSHLIIKLPRGHKYRIWFEAEALSQTELLGVSSANVQAWLKKLWVSVGEDKAEQNVIMEERQLESLIENNKMLTSLYLPEKYGGKLETVGLLLIKLIGQQKDAGLDIGEAQTYIDYARTAYDAGEYKMCYRNLINAYDSLQNPILEQE